MNSSHIPTGWSSVSLNDLRQDGDYTFVGGPFGSDLTQRDYIDEGVPVIRGTNLGGDEGKFIDDGFVFVSEDKAKSLRRNLAFRGDIVFTQRGTLGQVAIIPDYARFNKYIISQSQMKLTPDASRVHTKYLYQYFRYGRTIAVLLSQTQATGVPHINLGILKKFPVSLPPLAEQRRIADILDRAEALRAKRRAALALLDTLTQSLFLDMFGDPVTNPKGWPIFRLSDVGSLDRGVSTHRPRNAPELLGGPFPLVQTGEIANCVGYVREYRGTYSELGFKQSKLWPAGTLCITIAANIAKTGILTFPACFPDSVVGFKAADSATVEYVRVWLSFLQKRLEDAAPESAQKNINLGILRQLSIPVPPLPLQQDFARRVAAIEQLRSSQRAGLETLDELFAVLQHRAFRGEL